MWLFSKPYPFLYHTKKNIAISTGVGLFIFFFQYLLTDVEAAGRLLVLSKIELSVLFGLITFFSMMLVFDIVPRLFFGEETKEKWTIGKEILFITTLLFVITLFNYACLFFILKNPTQILNIQSFLLVCINVIIIGLIPTFVLLWINYTVILKQNLKQAQIYNETLQHKLQTVLVSNPSTSSPKTVIDIPSNTTKEIIQFDVEQLLFIKSEGNYIEVYTKENDKTLKKVYRASIQSLENNLSQYPFIIRTHRSYLVNLQNIKQTKGNARNYQLFFDDTDLMAPVARSKFQEFHDALTAHS